MPLTPLLLALLTMADGGHAAAVAQMSDADTLRVYVSGAGDPVVLVPGLFGSAFSFRQVVQALEHEGVRIIIIEPLGVGRSARPPDADYSLTAQSVRIASVLDTLGTRDAVIVAQSVAASMVFRLAYTRPDLIRGIVSIEGGPAEQATSSSLRTMIRFSPVARMLDPRRILAGMIKRDMEKSSADPSWITNEIVLGYASGLARDFTATAGAFRGMAAATEPERLEDHLHEIDVPVILLLGETQHGSGPPKEQVAKLADLLPKFRADTVAGSGYFVQEENPGAVARAVMELLGRPTR